MPAKVLKLTLAVCRLTVGLRESGSSPGPGWESAPGGAERRNTV